MNKTQIAEYVNSISEWACQDSYTSKLLRNIDINHVDNRVIEIYESIGIDVGNQSKLYAAIVATNGVLMSRRRYGQLELSFPAILSEFCDDSHSRIFEMIIGCRNSVDFAMLISKYLRSAYFLPFARVNLVLLWEDIANFDSRMDEIKSIWVREYKRVGGITRNKINDTGEVL